MRLLVLATLFGVLAHAGDALQIQCYQCEMKHDCSTPEYVVNCTVNVQDMCQKEVLVKPDGIHYRKSCASSAACLIASSGYQQFCTGRLNSVCISCCNTALCNGPKRKRPVHSMATPNPQMSIIITLLLSLLSLSHLLHAACLI
ncbi:ly6/PLAUR domain-containing protein 1 [Hippocampus comes]|uniref:LY6/PLAUR domain containing 1 n=1 Tax=Hippocampus comes TaxID=109280 RepID=A0A3Q2YAY6_HIPCM|nr:PREDICTED: ly6/PLAUR domain-containing protein 1 [Hippocampus comes]